MKSYLTAVTLLALLAGGIALGQKPTPETLPGVTPLTLAPHDHYTEVRAYTVEEYTREHGRWPLTRAEANEIVAALKDSAAAHYTALSFYQQAVKSFARSSTPEQRERMNNNLTACAASSQRTMDLLDTWKKRAAELRD